MLGGTEKHLSLLAELAIYILQFRCPNCNAQTQSNAQARPSRSAAESDWQGLRQERGKAYLLHNKELIHRIQSGLDGFRKGLHKFMEEVMPECWQLLMAI